MLAASLIAKKRDGATLDNAEIRFLIDGFVVGDVADYQMSAFAMAVLLRGMNAEEIACLTQAMLDSGERLPRDSDHPPRIDKHSTGGLGDKVSLVLTPLLACHDVHVPMISGRGLGMTGGTLDKLEAIPGFCINLNSENQLRQLQDVGCFIVGASERIAPADRRLYALRDVTATVESVALITASILSKKLAANLDSLVMDIKVGSAAFMKTPDDAMRLAQSIVSTAKLAGLPTTALITDMDQPLGWSIGNAIEVNETLRILDNVERNEVLELTIQLCAEVLWLCGRYPSKKDAIHSLLQTIQSGAARERFDRMVAAQGGRLHSELPVAKAVEMTAMQDGYVSAIDCETLGRCIVEMGGGRRVTSDKIDPSVGVAIDVRIGDKVSKDQTLLKIHARADHERWLSEVSDVVQISDQFVAPRSLILSRVRDGVVAHES